MKRRTTQIALVLAWLGLLPLAPVRAADDAGIRSVFAFGAGNRALGLGGAYTGIADDASAPLWNPGGLGWVQRRMFDASYTSLYGLGINEGYAAIALPSWRYGTLGLTFQQFSVGGIDIRDDRNFVTGSDESDSQTQIGLGYGRALNGGWSLGGAVKVQRHNLAGFSGAGVGLDLGLAVHPGLALGSRSAWAERLSLGIAVQNAIQPTIRLDQSSVSDPVTARVGCGYWVPFSGRHAVLLSGDVEKTNDMRARGHLGFEALFSGVLALRAGFDADRMTAGTGVRLRDVSIGYVYEDNPIDAVHRFGASFRFGRSVTDSRLAAQQAEEAALEARLAEEFRKRQAEQIAVLLRDADAARRKGQFDTALELIGTVKLLDAEHAEARQLEATCLREKAQKLEAAGETTDAALTWSRLLALQPGDAAATAGQARCRSLSDRRAVRSNEMRQTFASAVEAFGAEDFVKARQGFARALEISPKDAEAREMLDRTQQAISRRAASLVQLADRLCREGVVQEAWDLADQARRLDPKAAGLEELSARLRAARAVSRTHTPPASPSGPAPGSGAPAPTAHAGPSPAATQEVEDLYRRGVGAMQSGRTQDAVRYWELVWGMDPDYQRVREHLKREYMTQGLERFAQGDLAEAIAQWEKALRVDPADARAVAYLARAQEQLTRTREILGDGHRGSP
jgi:tetratricopeptide (TPR) repeat protein